MQAGKLDRVVSLQHVTLTKDTTTGERVQSWSTYDTVRAQKVELRGRELFAAAETRYELSVKFRIRYRTDVLQTDRLIFGGGAYDIQDITEIGRAQGLELVCVTVTAV